MAHRKLKDEMMKYTQRFYQEASELYKVIIPAKALELKEMLRQLEQKGVFISTAASHHLNGEDDVMGNMPGHNRNENVLRTCDPSLRDLMEKLKPTYTEGLLHASKIRTWLALLVPKSSYENSVLGEAREAILKAVENLEQDSRAGLSGVTEFYRYRAKCASKAVKYPQVEDYRLCLREHDEEKLALLHVSVRALGERYTVLYDALVKNIAIIEDPLTDKTDPLGMY